MIGETYKDSGDHTSGYTEVLRQPNSFEDSEMTSQFRTHDNGEHAWV